jgi:hypothetical protein
MGDAVKPALHGRDHCPGGTDPIPCFPRPVRWRARRKTTFQTLGSSGAETELLWNFWENDDDSVWTQYAAGGALETTTTNPVRTVQLEVPAVVWIGGCISVQTLGAAAGSQIVIVINDGYDHPEIVVHPKQVAGAGGDYNFNHIRSYPVVDPSDDPGGEAQFSIDAAQNGGTNRDTTFGTYWELVAFVL